MAQMGRSGITANTPESIFFGAGTYHKNLKYTSNAWNAEESIIGATNGGGKLTYKPIITPIELDGADVRVKGLDVKTGEEGALECNFAEITEDLLKAALIAAKADTSDVTGYDLIETKEDIEDSDYWENIAFVGRTVKGQNIIVIMENPICTSGLELDAKKNEGSVGTFTFEPRATLEGSHRKLPIKIYYPTSA